MKNLHLIQLIGGQLGDAGLTENSVPLGEDAESGNLDFGMLL